MKLSLLLMALPAAIYAQDSLMVNTGPTPYSSGSARIEKFDNKARLFKDWAVSIGGGTALMQSADLTSFYDNKINWGWNGYVSIDKQISHTFGLSLAYQMGELKTKGQASIAAGVANAWTKYHQVALIGDLNFSNLMRRVDNHSPYRWALHGYAGIGLQGYNTRLTDNTRWPIEIKQKLGLDSFFYQFGSGIVYNASKLIDIEARAMYVATGDDSFDGGGWDSYDRRGYNQIHQSHSDNYFTVNLGFTFKLGKNETHLRWFDPLQNYNYRIKTLMDKPSEVIVCQKGDGDNDGVCDDWDRQLDTPAGARVDGAGVALDMDLDGVIDLNDKCVTVPGPIENQGCPTSPVANLNSVQEINKDFEGIEFALAKDIIRPVSFAKLDHAAEVIKTLDGNAKFAVIGCTDTRSSEQYNQDLSQRRANAVVKYLVSKGVNSSMLIPEGHGEKDLKYPECDPATKCPEWKNEANRRVYFQAK